MEKAIGTKKGAELVAPKVKGGSQYYSLQDVHCCPCGK